MLVPLFSSPDLLQLYELERVPQHCKPLRQAYVAFGGVLYATALDSSSIYVLFEQSNVASNYVFANYSVRASDRKMSLKA